MSHVLVIIAGPGQTLTQPLVGEVVAKLPSGHRGPVQWLAKGHACEFSVVPWDGDGRAEHWQGIEGMTAYIDHAIIVPARTKWPIDIALVPANNRRKKLLVADMESTIIREELVDELAVRTGRGEEVAAITAKAMRGELDFAEALRERVVQFAGLEASLLDDLYESSVSLMPGAETLVRTMRKHGAFTALVSGGFTIFTARIAERLGFDAHHGNTLEIERGQITGRVAPPILDRAGKAKTLRELTDIKKLDPADTLAVGDGANDLDMLATAGLGVAYHGKPVVVGAADAAIQHGDLTSLLYLQGYKRNEFVETAANREPEPS